MICEMCGQEVEAVSRVRVEGSVLNLCASCARFGTPLDPPATATAHPASAGSSSPHSAAPRPVARSRNTEERDLFRELPEMELAEDWPKRIRQAREKLGWTPEEFAKRLNEKKSLVLKMEAGHFRPPDATIRKVESLLKVRLRAEPSAAAGA